MSINHMWSTLCSNQVPVKHHAFVDLLAVFAYLFKNCYLSELNYKI